MLVAKLKPLLEANNVALYLNGHDHNLQHLAQNGVDYVVSGAGHELAHKQENAGNVPAGAQHHRGARAISENEKQKLKKTKHKPNRRQACRNSSGRRANSPTVRCVAMYSYCFLKKPLAAGGFVTITFNDASTLDVNYYDSNLNVLYSFAVKNRR